MSFDDPFMSTQKMINKARQAAGPSSFDYKPRSQGEPDWITNMVGRYRAQAEERRRREEEARRRQEEEERRRREQMEAMLEAKRRQLEGEQRRARREADLSKNRTSAFERLTQTQGPAAPRTGLRARNDPFATEEERRAPQLEASMRKQTAQGTYDLSLDQPPIFQWDTRTPYERIQEAMRQPGATAKFAEGYHDARVRDRTRRAEQNILTQNPGIDPDLARETAERIGAQEVQALEWVENLTPETIDWMEDHAGFGRGVSDNERFRKNLHSDPIGTLASIPELSTLNPDNPYLQVLPDWMQGIVAERRGLDGLTGAAAEKAEREATAPYRRNQYGRLSGLVRDGLNTIVDIGPGLTDETGIDPILIDIIAQSVDSIIDKPISSMAANPADQAESFFTAPIVGNIAYSVTGRTPRQIIGDMVPGEQWYLEKDNPLAAAWNRAMDKAFGITEKEIREDGGWRTDINLADGVDREDLEAMGQNLYLWINSAADIGSFVIGATTFSQGPKQALKSFVANVGPDVAAAMISLPLIGINPDDPEYWRTVAIVAAASSAGNVATAEGFSGTVARNVAAPVASGTAAYSVGGAVGLEEDEKRKLAAAAAAGAVAARYLPEERRGAAQSTVRDLAGRIPVPSGLRRSGTGQGVGEVAQEVQSPARVANRIPGQAAYTSLDEIPDPPAGATYVYHGTGADNVRQPWDGMFVTPNKEDAMRYAEGDVRFRNGGTPKVYAFEAQSPTALRPTGSDDFATARGAQLVNDPAGLRLVPKSASQLPSGELGGTTARAAAEVALGGAAGYGLGTALGLSEEEKVALAVGGAGATLGIDAIVRRFPSVREMTEVATGRRPFRQAPLARADFDDVSKINSQTFYHAGGTAGIEAADISSRSSNVVNRFGPGFYMSDDFDFARQFGRSKTGGRNPVVYEVHLDTNKVLNLNNRIRDHMELFRELRKIVQGDDSLEPRYRAADAPGMDRIQQAFTAASSKHNATFYSVWRSVSQTINDLVREGNPPESYRSIYDRFHNHMNRLGYDAAIFRYPMRDGARKNVVFLINGGPVARMAQNPLMGVPGAIGSAAATAGRTGRGFVQQAADAGVTGAARDVAEVGTGAAGGYILGAAIGADEDERARMALVGAGIMGIPKVGGRLFRALDDMGRTGSGPAPERPGELNQWIEGGRAVVRDDDFLVRARNARESAAKSKNPVKRAVADAMYIPAKVAEIVDPRTKYGHAITSAVTAAADYLRWGAVAQPEIRRDIENILTPLTRKSGLKSAFEKVEYNTRMRRPRKGKGKQVLLSKSGFDLAKMPDKLKSGKGRLLHILIHPDDFKLSPEQVRAVQRIQQANEAQFQSLNDAFRWAGMEEVAPRRGNYIHQWFTEESVADILRTNPFQARPNVPYFLQDLAREQERRLGADAVDAIIKHPELEIAGDPIDLIMRGHEQAYRGRSNAILVKALQDEGELMAPRQLYDELSTLYEQKRGAQATLPGLDERIAAVRKQIKDAENAYRQANPDMLPLPGVQSYAFPREMVDKIAALSPEGDRLLGFWDRLTAEVRTASFSLDGSGWTMQGYLTMIADPVGTLLNSPQLLAASVFGEDYAHYWFRKNPEWVKKATQAGVVLGREHGKAEEGTFVLSKFGPARALDERQFVSFLPMFRAMQFKHMVEVEAFLEHAFGRNTATKVTGAVGTKELSRLAIESAEFLPPALAAVVLGQDGDYSDEDKIFIAAIGAGSIAAVRGVPPLKIRGLRSRAAEGAMRGLTDQQMARTAARVGRHLNRVSGTLNKQAQGISQQQAMWERVLFFRSPALFRNTLSLAKLALTDPGTEGQLARNYLLKTGLVLGSTIAAIEYLSTGQMPNLDPRDEDSIFHPSHFLRADMGEAGKLTTSNPWVSLIRAALYQEYVEGAPDWTMENWNPAGGLSSFVQSRTPDVAGPLINDFLNAVAPAPQFDEEPALTTPQGISRASEAVKSGSVSDAINVAIRSVAPVAVRDALETGLIATPWHTDVNPSFNTPLERILGVVMPLAGLNYNPETLSQERRREIVETTGELGIDAPTGPDGQPQLTSLERERVKQANPYIDQLGEQIAGQYEGEDVTPDPVDSYFADRQALVERRAERFRELERAVEGGQISKFEYRAERGKIMDWYSEERDRLEAEYSQQRVGRQVWIDGRATDPTVTEYLARNTRPEDQALEDYFDLADRATKNGIFDFDTYDRLKQEFMASNPHAGYVQEWLGQHPFEAPTELEREYDRVKEIAEPYWEIRNDLWTEMRDYGVPMMQMWESYDAFRDDIRRMAEENGIAEEDLMTLIGRHPQMKMFNKAATLMGYYMRGENPALDVALDEWYDIAPVNDLGIMAARYGDNSLLTPEVGMAMATLKARGNPFSTEQRTAIGAAYRRRYGREPDPYVDTESSGLYTRRYS